MTLPAMLRPFLAALLMLAALTGATAQEATRFDIFEYRVEGTHLLPVALVEQAVYPHLGEARSLADVEKAREALEAAYHGAGYLTALVAVPPQKVADGVVRLHVTEAGIDRLRVIESRYFSLGEIRAGVPELAEGNVPHFPQMQKELAALNRGADRRVTPVLRPGVTPGTVEVDLKVKDRLPLHGNLELNDRHSPDTSRTRLSASLRWDNLWQAQHGLGITLQTAPEKPAESRVFSASYTLPLASGNYLALYGVKSESDVAAVGTLNVLGKGTIAGLRYIVPLRSRGENFFHSTTLGFDYKDFDQSVVLVDSGGFATPIRYAPFTLGWDASRAEEGRSSKLGLSVNFQMRGLVAQEQEFADKRFKGKPNYFYVRGNLSHEENWPAGWGLKGRLNWQYTSQPLIANEQFALGGADSVRGYAESVALGEKGYSLGFEALGPNLARHLAGGIDELRLLAFYETAAVAVIEPITATDQFKLAGAGLGLRLKAGRNFSAHLDWARALKDHGKTRAGDRRLHFRLGAEW